MSKTAVLAENVSKIFRVYNSPTDMVREVLWGQPRHRDFTALDDVSFTVGRGKVLGLIGRNGAGKSTLLKIIAGTLEASAGRIDVDGRVSAILELGTGFNPEYTGRENIYLGGMCLGLTRQEVRAREEEIIAFSELEEFIDQPFKIYSSGMQARLTFSVAVSVDPDILIIDEALSVGDAKFQRKCFAMLQSFKTRGVSILFVSHDPQSVQHIADQVIILERGRIVFDGDSGEGLKQYTRLLFEGDVETATKPADVYGTVGEDQDRLEGAEPSTMLAPREQQAEVAPKELRYGSGEVHIDALAIINAEGKPTTWVVSNEPFSIVLRVVAKRDVENLSAGFRLTTVQGLTVYGTSCALQSRTFHCRKDEVMEIVFRCEGNLAPGTYFLTAGIAQSDDTAMFDRRVDAIDLRVVGHVGAYTVSLVNLRAQIECKALKLAMP